MSIHVLDASAIVAYVAGESGDEAVTRLLADPTAECYAHSMNLCEVYYNAIRSTGIPRARETMSILFADGVIERRDMSRRFWQRVGEHKARGRISLPDCF